MVQVGLPLIPHFNHTKPGGATVLLFRLFRSTHPLVYLYLLIYAFLLKGLFFVIAFPGQVFFTNALVGNWLYDLIRMQHPWVRALEPVMLVYIQALLVNFIHTRFQLTERQTFIPAFIFITVTSLLPEFLMLTPVMLSYLFVLLAFRELFQLPFGSVTSEKLFYTSLLLGASTLFYWPVAIFLAVVLLGLFQFARAGWRDFAIILIAFLLPYYFMGIYFYYQDRLFEYNELLLSVLPRAEIAIHFTIAQWVLIGYVIILLVYGYFEVQRSSGNFVIRLKRYYQHIQYTLLILLVPVFFIHGDKIFYLYFFSFPVTVFLVPIFNRDRPGWFRTVLFLLLLLFAGYFQWQFAISGQLHR